MRRARAAGREVRYYLQTAHGCLTLIRLSTTEITGPWLGQAMAPRIASTLNYFLLHLTGAARGGRSAGARQAPWSPPPPPPAPKRDTTPAAVPSAGPERRKLKIKDPERYGWQPKTVLAQIAAIYVHLARGDASGRLAAAVAADSRSYRDEMFLEAAQARAPRLLSSAGFPLGRCERSAGRGAAGAEVVRAAAGGGGGGAGGAQPARQRRGRRGVAGARTRCSQHGRAPDGAAPHSCRLPAVPAVRSAPAHHHRGSGRRRRTCMLTRRTTLSTS